VLWNLILPNFKLLSHVAVLCNVGFGIAVLDYSWFAVAVKRLCFGFAKTSQWLVEALGNSVADTLISVHIVIDYIRTVCLCSGY